MKIDFLEFMKDIHQSEMIQTHVCH